MVETNKIKNKSKRVVKESLKKALLVGRKE